MFAVRTTFERFPEWFHSTAGRVVIIVLMAIAVGELAWWIGNRDFWLRLTPFQYQWISAAILTLGLLFRDVKHKLYVRRVKRELAGLCPNCRAQIKDLP